MMRKFTSLVAALALAAASLAPGAADARDRHGHGGYNYYHGGRHYYGDRDRHGDAVAAGAIGLILGLAIGSIASQPQQGRCYDRCGPPPGRGYYNQGYNGDPRYDQGESAYEEDYGVKDAVEGYQCTRPERQYDRYAGRTVTVDVPC